MNLKSAKYSMKTQTQRLIFWNNSVTNQIILILNSIKLKCSLANECFVAHWQFIKKFPLIEIIDRYRIEYPANPSLKRVIKSIDQNLQKESRQQSKNLPFFSDHRSALAICVAENSPPRLAEATSLEVVLCANFVNGFYDR